MPANEVNPFWMVFGIGCREPRYQHATEAQAVAEAERLAGVSPGTTFVVLEAVTAIRKREFDHVNLRSGPAQCGAQPRKEDLEDDIPF